MPIPAVILNFHGVGPVPRDLDAGEADCWLEQSTFEAILDRVKETPGTILTVDDGNESDHHFVLPALLSRGLTATFFLCSGRLDQPTFLAREQLRGLIQNKMRIGTHGVDHLNWRELSSGRLHQELHGSRQILESVCEQPVTAAACPFGAYDRRVLRALRGASFESVYTSDGGWTTGRDWLRPRLTVRRSMNPDLLTRGVACPPSMLAQLLKRTKLLLKRWR